MQYIIGDIHGCYDEYKKLLEKIRFKNEDTLYVLGDAMDRGPEPMKVIKDIIRRPNVIYIIGNHDLLFYVLMKKALLEVTDENVQKMIDTEFLSFYSAWQKDGGDVTASQFHKLSDEQKRVVLDFMRDASLYEEIFYKEKRYILVHGGLGEPEKFSESRPLSDYDMSETAEMRADYGKRYFSDPNTFLVTGHTPTPLIEGFGETKVYQKNGHIGMDCGCFATGVLAAYCIETEKVTYVSRES